MRIRFRNWKIPPLLFVNEEIEVQGWQVLRSREFTPVVIDPKLPASLLSAELISSLEFLDCLNTSTDSKIVYKTVMILQTILQF